MKVIITKDNQNGGHKAFELIKQAMANGAKVLGLATGSSPIPLYQDMVKSDLDFSQMTSINLDEYVGLAPDDPQSYHYFMNQHLFKSKPFKQSFIPNGLAKDPQAETARYDHVIESHPIDLQILGIGRNGHIAFNEPGSSFASKTRHVKLTENTIEANSRFFKDEAQVPHYAYCMGIASIMKSKQIILLAFGAQKAKAIKATIEGPISEQVPASVLQNHPDVTIICDDAAASELSRQN